MANLFLAMGKKTKTKCTHATTVTRVIDSSATCETTVKVCANCAKTLTQPKTDCV